MSSENPQVGSNIRKRKTYKGHDLLFLRKQNGVNIEVHRFCTKPLHLVARKLECVSGEQ